VVTDGTTGDAPTAVRGEALYRERLASARTEALFVTLALVGGGLLAWRLAAGRVDGLAVLGACVGGFFLFYALNFRTLMTRVTPQALTLRFGVIRWTVVLDNVAACALDELPALQRYGGAGVHFMRVRGRYRANFNFLEYPRVVVALKRPAGPVRDVSFSTRRPDAVLSALRAALADL
jgi:hypothetical protein